MNERDELKRIIEDATIRLRCMQMPELWQVSELADELEERLAKTIIRKF